MLKAMAGAFKDAVWYRNLYPALNPNEVFNELEILSGVRCIRISVNSIEALGLHRASKFFTHLAAFHPSILEIHIFEHKFSRRRTCCDETVEFFNEAQRRLWYKDFQQIGRPHPHPTRTRTMLDWRQEYFFENQEFRNREGSTPTELPPLRFFGATHCKVAPRQLLNVITGKKESSIPVNIHFMRDALMLTLTLIP